MQVIDLPDERPIITGASQRGYRVGEWLDVNCTSPKSKPPALLKWYINDEKPTENYVVQIPPQEEAGDLWTARLRLRFQLKRQHFVQGHVSLKCTASIYSEYFTSTSAVYPGLGLGEKALESRRTNGKTCLINALCASHCRISGLYTFWYHIFLAFWAQLCLVCCPTY